MFKLGDVMCECVCVCEFYSPRMVWSAQVKDSEMGRARGTYAGEKKAYRDLVTKSEGRRQL